MPNWKEVIEEIQKEGQAGIPNPFDTVRRKYIAALHKKPVEILLHITAVGFTNQETQTP